MAKKICSVLGTERINRKEEVVLLLTVMVILGASETSLPASVHFAVGFGVPL